MRIVLFAAAAGLIYWLGTSLFSASRMEPLFYPYFRSLLHAHTGAQLFWYLSIVRWSAHYLEYFILCLMLSRVVGLRPATAMILCLLLAAADEGHQYFIPDRTCSLRDLGYDAAGAISAFILLKMGRKPASAAARVKAAAA